MGGTGARSRRRLQRQANAEGGAAGTSRNDQVDHVNKHNRAKKVDGTPGTKSPTKQPVKTLKTKAKKQKVRKPKHLKRKLEALGGQDAAFSYEKERLLNEMQMWEENKNKFQKQNQNQIPSQGNISEKQNEESQCFPPSKHNRDEESPSSPQEPKRRNDAVFSNVEHRQQSQQQQASPNDKNNSDGDDEDSVALPKKAPARQRGKRRRGRKDTSQKIQEQQQAEATKQGSNVNNQTDKLRNSTKPLDSSFLDEIPNQKRQKTQTNDNRYCKGRKPVTDFVIGQSYTGKVVYVKPFGIFLDIGCHSDAFCHVSRLQDDYVESAESLFQPGDEVQAARVIEIDRAQKRITVSLQSDAMREIELQSIEAREGRKGKREERTSAGSGKARKTSLPADNDRSSAALDSAKEHTAVKETTRKDSLTVDPKTKYNHSDQLMTNRNTAPLKPESSPAELKRARKLARRAARRAEQETSNSEGPTADQ